MLVCVFGIYGAYLTQGVVQETLSTKRFGVEKERFDHLPALTALQSWACFVWALSLLRVAPASLGGAVRGPGAAPPPPVLAYWRPAVSNSIGPACGLQALRYISYPAQVLAKSSKMIPVMLVGTVLHGKRYPALEYACCAAVSAGVSLFALRSSSKAKSRLASPNAPLGYSLCLANLILDGYTNAAQDEIHRKHPGGSPLHMMAWMNFWCGLFYLPALFVLSSAGPDLLRFCAKHPEAARDVALFCVCGAVGQLFIFYAIKRFGSLTNTIVTTTRKFFNILLSALWNGTALLPQQWIAVLFVFGGIAVSSYSKSKAKRKAH